MIKTKFFTTKSRLKLGKNIKGLSNLLRTRIAIALFLVTAITITIAFPLVQGEAGRIFSTEIRLNDVESPSLLYKTEKTGLYLLSPIVKTEVDLSIEGMILRGTVTQKFHNNSDSWVEGVYVFPLPENSAVDYMKLIIGDRIIEGKIKEKQQAKKIYEKAKREGKKASLVEQERPNIFTTSVANIGPGEEIDVVIRYQQDLHYENGRFSFRFPMVVGPRFIPGTTKVDGFEGTGWGVNTTDVTDAERITPPVVDPSNGKINPVEIRIDLNAGFPLAHLESKYHKIKVRDGKDNRKLIELEGDNYADKDFVLEWEPEIGKAPNAALFTETFMGEKYILLMVMPPNKVSADKIRIPRETIFIIDTSGSMAGTSIKQAKEALLYAVDQLKPDDTFNIIEFNDRPRKYSETSVRVTEDSIDDAKKFVEYLNAGGGTVMLSALRAALENQQETSRLRQVVFMTDGAVGNEDQLFTYIKYNLGSSRLFTIGIGSAPNSYFMNKSAEFGKGIYTYIGSVGEVEDKMKDIFKKLENPFLSDIEVHWNGEKVEAYPDKIPDLYQGQPIMLSARMMTSSAPQIMVTGKRGSENWKVDLNLTGGSGKGGLSKLWARKKIAKYMDRYRTEGKDENIRDLIVEMALKYHLVSKFTSLVAVDVTPSRPAEEKLEKKAVPTNLPAGWKYKKVFGGLPQTGTSAMMEIIIGLILLIGAGIARFTFLRG